MSRSTIRRIGGCVVAAAALAIPATAHGMAINGPGCTTTLVSPVNASPSCGFDSPTDYSTIHVEPVGTVTVTVRCNNFGYSSTSSRTVSANTSWRASTAGSCSLGLTAVSSGAAANATATPTLRPIEGP